jgi:nitroreductase
MEVLEAIRSARRVDRFRSDPIPDRTIQTVFNAARLAFSAENLQPWKFVLVTAEDLKRRLAAACTEGRALAEASAVVVACGLLDEAVATVGGYMNSYPVDLGVAIAHLSLAAADQGLGTRWVYAFNEDKVKAILNIPPDVKVVGLTALGYPAEEPTAPEGRKHLSEILAYNRYE